MRLVLTMVTCLLAGCASMSGQVLSIPADAAKEGDVATTVMGAILVPILLPFALVADAFVLVGGGDFDKGVETVSTLASASSASSMTAGAAATAGACSCVELTADASSEILRNKCSQPIMVSWCAEGLNCQRPDEPWYLRLGAAGGDSLGIDHFRITNGDHRVKDRPRLPWGYAAVARPAWEQLPQPRPRHITEFESRGWLCERNRAPAPITMRRS